MVTGQGLGRGVVNARDGVAHAGVGDGLDGRGQVADLARAEALGRDHALRVQISDLHDLIDRTGGHHADVHAGPDRAVHDAQVDDRAAVGIVLAVKDQALQRRFAVAGGGGDVVHDHFQHGMDVDAVFGGDLRRVHGGDADDVLDLLLDLGGPGCGEVDLVDDGQDLQPVVDGEIGVGQRLGLDALRRVDDQHRALTGGQAARDLIVEVDVARGVDEVQDVVFAVVGAVVQTDGAGLDGDAALALKVHGVEDLVLHLALFDRVAFLEQAVGQRGFAVVNVGDDGKIADMRKVGHSGSSQ